LREWDWETVLKVRGEIVGDRTQEARGNCEEEDRVGWKIG